MTTIYNGVKIITENGVHTIGDKTFKTIAEAMDYALTL